ncbi:MAG: alpha/beta hydrolase, partial [Promethearchaeota archaeon]
MWNLMSERSKNYQKTILVAIFLGLFTLGTFLIFTIPTSIEITYNQTVETKDGVQVSFNTFKPQNGEKKMKAVIIGHGVIVNKEMLKGYAIELACAGFFVVTIDFRGHGLSSGELMVEELTNEVKAVKEYLKDRDDVDANNLGYIGYSMGGFPGNEIVKKDEDFKCFIGVGTGLDIKKDDIDPGRKLNILMIIGQYDQAFQLKELKNQFGDLIEEDSEDVVVNRLYGGFQEGNASKIFLDDNSDHLLTAWDQDFIREARDWVKNTFRSVDPVDQNFYANIRFYILILQLIGGIGLFFLLIPIISSKLVEYKEDEVYKLEVEEESMTDLTKSIVLYSFLFFIPGLLLMIPLLLLLPLMIAGLMVMLLFGQAFGMLMYLRKYGKKKEKSLVEVLKEPFQISRDSLIRNILLGSILAILLYLILYLTIGLNYLGMAPNITKWPWIPIYFVVMCFNFLIFQMIFNGAGQNKLGDTNKDTLKGILMAF